MRTRRKQKLSLREESTVDPIIDNQLTACVAKLNKIDACKKVTDVSKRMLSESHEVLCLLCIKPAEVTKQEVPIGHERWLKLLPTLSDILMIPIHYFTKFSEFWICACCMDQILSVETLWENIKELELRIQDLKNRIINNLYAENKEVNALSSEWNNPSDVLNFRAEIRRVQNRKQATTVIPEYLESMTEGNEITEVHEKESRNLLGTEFIPVLPSPSQSVNDDQRGLIEDFQNISLDGDAPSFHIDHEEILIEAPEVALHVFEPMEGILCDFLDSKSGKCSLVLSDESKMLAHRRSHRLYVNLVDFNSSQLNGTVTVTCPHPGCGGKGIPKEYFELHMLERHKKYVCLHLTSNDPEVLCLQLFDTKDRRDDHRDSHYQARCVVPCCDQNSVSLPLFKDHVLKQHQLYACVFKNNDRSVCSQLFQKEGDVDHHKKYDHDYMEDPKRTVLEVTNPDSENGNCSCHVCGSKYIPVTQFAMHVRRHGYFVCLESNVDGRECLSYFPTKVCIETHLESEHSKEGSLSYGAKLVPWKFNRPFGVCRICGKSGLLEVDTFRQHVKEHGYLVCDGEDLATGKRCIKYFCSTHKLYVHRLSCKLVTIDSPTGRLYSEYKSSLYCKYCKELLYFDRRETWEDHMQTHEAVVCHSKDPLTNQRCYHTELSALLMKYHQEAKHSNLDADNASLCSEISDDDSEMLSFTRPVNVTIEESYFLNSDGQLLEGIFCKYCGIEFERRDKLWEEHIQSHGGLICDVFIPDKNEPCHKVFESITDFARHCRKDHSRVRSAAAPVKCKKCCYAAQTNEKLKQHRKKHQPRRPAMCELCGRSFFDMNNLRDHIALVHEDKDKLNFYCDICNQGFKLKSHLRYHKNAVHEEKRVTCEVCGRIYSYQNFKRHAAKHVEAKLKCPVSECGKLFATPGDVKVHVNRSHGERKFACQRCPWTFQTNMALKRHEIVVHENLRPYKCDVCGATMKSKGHLNQHKKKHELGLLPKNAPFRPVSRRLKSPPAVV